MPAGVYCYQTEFLNMMLYGEHQDVLDNQMYYLGKIYQDE